MVNRFTNKSKQKTIICHDMMNNYIGDNILWFGGEREIPFFRFYHFMNSDIFIYFSHEFISIPPLSYNLISDRLGNKMLATIITEHSPGQFKLLI